MSHLRNPSHCEPATTATIVIHEPQLDCFVTRFDHALATHWPNSILSYSFKTSALPWFLTYLRGRGVWAEVISDTEYALALAVGYRPQQIIFNGPIKDRGQLRYALREESVVNLDSKSDVLWTTEFALEQPETRLEVGLRVNWDLNAYGLGDSHSGNEDRRFGFNPANGELDQAIATLTEVYRKRPFAYRIDTDSTTKRSIPTIDGYTCMEDDRLIDLRDEPASQPEDRITFDPVGGYTMCYQADTPNLQHTATASGS